MIDTKIKEGFASLDKGKIWLFQSELLRTTDIDADQDSTERALFFP